MKFENLYLTGGWFVSEVLDSENRRFRIWECDSLSRPLIATALHPNGSWVPLSPGDTRALIAAHRTLMGDTE